MKKLFRFVVMTLMAAFTAISCDLPAAPDGAGRNGQGNPGQIIVPGSSPTAERGTITLRLGGGGGTSGARSILSDDFIATGLVYQLTFVGPSGTYTMSLNEPAQTFQLEVGAWTIDAIAYRKTDNVEVGTGAQIQVTIQADQALNRTFTMTVNSGYESTQTVFYIHSPAELNRLHPGDPRPLPTSAGKEFHLERDISVSDWIPLGPANNNQDDLSGESDPFDATFDGHGHTITITSFAQGAGLENAYHMGLFSYLMGNATIKNLKVVYGATVSTEADPILLITMSADQYMGGLAGTINGATIENVHVSVSGADAAIIVEKRGMANSVSVGGITGNLIAGTISESSFTGIIKGKGYFAVNAGGLVGATPDTLTAPFPAISESFALGTMEAAIDSPGTTQNAYAGGILGSGSVSINQAYAYAKVSAIGGKQAYAGGIAGRYRGTAITNAYAVGTVSAEAAGTSVGDPDNAIAGGIFGQGDTIGVTRATANHSVALQTSIKAVSTTASNTEVVSAIGNGNGIVPATSPGYFNFAAPDISFIPTNTRLDTSDGNYAVYMQNNGYIAYCRTGTVNDTYLYRADFQGVANQATYTTRKAMDTTYGSLTPDVGLNWDFTTVWQWRVTSGYHYPVFAWETADHTSAEAAAGGLTVDWGND
ncbi:hypothetical protein LQZ19_17265 [Treponema primitia]|uniref:hypothetical protein n=1 Tax=Treponema primitia TaxID=88058 RepID=UPI0039808C66